MTVAYKSTVRPRFHYAVELIVPGFQPDKINLALIGKEGKPGAVTSLEPAEVDALIKSLQAARGLMS